MFLVIAFPILAETFEKYDFTFYKTVDGSVAIMNDERLGFDYTGYGFLGQNMTTGLYIRFGMQAPYSTLISIFEKDSDQQELPEDSSQLPSADSGDTDSDGSDAIALPDDVALIDSNKSSQIKLSDEDANPDVKGGREFVFSSTIGPAFRHFISNEVVWYMGLGISSKITESTTGSNSNGIFTSFELNVGSDLDMGFRLDIASNTSLRIGVHVTTGLITYTNSSFSDPNDNVVFSNEIKADIFTKVGEKSSTEASGYIGLAHVFKPKVVQRYRYSNKTSILGGGTIYEL